MPGFVFYFPLCFVGGMGFFSLCILSCGFYLESKIVSLLLFFKIIAIDYYYYYFKIWLFTFTITQEINDYAYGITEDGVIIICCNASSRSVISKKKYDLLEIGKITAKPSAVAFHCHGEEILMEGIGDPFGYFSFFWEGLFTQI